MAKKTKLLAITHMYPNSAYPIAGIFIKNQFDKLVNDMDITVVMPYPWVPNISSKTKKFSEVSYKEQKDGITTYYPKYVFIPFFRKNETLLSVLLWIESWFSYWGVRKTVKKIMDKEQPNIVQIHSGISESRLVKWVKQHYNVPVVTMFHGDDLHRYSEMNLLRSLSTQTIKYSEAIICKSKPLLDAAKKLVPSVKGEVIASGYNTSVFKIQDKEKNKQKINYKSKEPLVLFVGHLEKRKGVMYLLDAISQLEISANCIIIGDGSERQALEKQRQKLNLNSVSFLGKKQPKEIVDYMNAADLLVLPSLSEGLPNVLCESLACGTPVVATNISGNPEIVTEKVGVLVKSKDAKSLANGITKALSKKWNKKELLSQAKKFSVDESVKKTKKIYDRVISTFLQK